MKKITLATISFLIILLPLAGISNNLSGGKYFTLPKSLNESDYKAKTVIFKIKDDHRAQCTANGIEINIFNQYMSNIGATSIAKIFPNHQKPERETNEQGLKYADLSLIYEVNYTADIPLVKVINSIFGIGIAEYAQPYYLQKFLYIPNDPYVGSEPHLNRINAYNGWNIEQGDPNVIIGIADTGIDVDHEDLISNIAPGGWNVADNNANVQETTNPHGCHVSGCAAASTDNGIGVAAPGFNCRVLPVKISDGAGNLVAGYQGITYAADNGADIINCSWGGGGGGSFGQDVITYATINQDALVVAAAGNSGSEGALYPASYDYAINVAGTNNNNDIKWGGSTYDLTVDVCAPANGILSTTNGDNYAAWSGTSMASPLAAGAAALIKSQNLGWTALQVGEQLKVTCVNIDGINPAYAGKLGYGRINMFDALSGMSQPSVLMSNMLQVDNNDNTFVVDDTIRISADFTNYLLATGSITATLTESSPWITILDNNSALGTINTLATVNNSADPFQVKINTGTPLNTVVSFTLNLDDGSYSTDFYFDMTINVDYINISISQVASTITSKNGIGYNQDGQLEGLGFEYPLGTTMMWDAGVMFGVSNTKVSDHVRDQVGGTNDDFVSVMNVKKIPNVFSEFDVEGKFNDDGAGGSKLDIEVHQKAFAWSSPGHDKYVIFEYNIKNTGASSLSNFYAGIFVDWDIMDYLQNMGAEDAVRKLGYSYSTEVNGLYAGVRALMDDSWNHYAIDNDGSGGSIDLYAEYSTADKYLTLSSARTTAGMGDVSDVVSHGPYTINAGDSILVAFALIAGDDLADLQENSDSAYAMYGGGGNPINVPINPNDGLSLDIYPNPASDITTIALYLPKEAHVNIEIYDLLGQKTMDVANSNAPKGNNIYRVNLDKLQNGVYFYKFTLDNKQVITRKIAIVN